MSNAGSEDFGQFLEKVNDLPPLKEANVLPRPNAANNRTRIAAGTSANVPSRVFLPEPTSGSVPFRIRTRRPINLRLVPPPETSVIPEVSRSHDGPNPMGLPAAGEAAGEAASNFRIFTREQVRQFKIPRPPSSVLSGRANVTPDDTTNNFTINNALRWRLRGLRGDNASATDLRVLEESDRFTLGSFKSSGGSTNGTGVEGITTGMRRALDSQYVHVRRKRRKQAADDEGSTDSDPPNLLDQLSDEPKRDAQASDGSEHEGDLNIGISNEIAEDADIGIEGSSDNDNSSVRSGRPPSRLSSESIEIDAEPLFVEEPTRSHADVARAGMDRENVWRSELNSESDSSRLRPRDPHEIEGPLIFDVPISEMPNIDWGADDVDIDGQFLEQQLEHSESESDEESDAGSVAEIIDDSSDDDATYLNSIEVEKEWNPDAAIEGVRGVVLSDDSSDSDDDRVEALTESEGESDTNDCVDFDADIAESVSMARRNRGKRNRIPRVNFWLGERIEYERLGKRQLMTAIDVHRVEPPKKTYRKRRLHRPKRSAQTQIFDELEANADQKEVMVPVFDTASREWRDRTVARSIAGLDFVPVLTEDGARMPMVTRCVLFGGKQDSAPLRLCVLRIEPGGVFSSNAEQNKAITFVVWRGKCTVHLNNHEFDLMKGMACLVPRGNDFFVDNGGGDRPSTGDVYLFFTEINAEANPELADAMARDAQSMISGAAAISNFFESDHGNSEHGSPTNGNNSDTEPQDNQNLTSSIGEDVLHAVDYFGDSDANNSNETRDTFGPGFAQALGSDSGVQKDAHAAYVRPKPAELLVQAAHSHPPPESLRSFSYALGSEREFPRPAPSSQDRNLARPPIKAEQEEFDSFDMLNDYLEGRKGNPMRLVLHERPVTNREEFRVRAYLETLSGNHSNLSRDSK